MFLYVNKNLKSNLISPFKNDVYLYILRLNIIIFYSMCLIKIYKNIELCCY